MLCLTHRLSSQIREYGVFYALRALNMPTSAAGPTAPQPPSIAAAVSLSVTTALTTCAEVIAHPLSGGNRRQLILLRDHLLRFGATVRQHSRRTAPPMVRLNFK